MMTPDALEDLIEAATPWMIGGLVLFMFFIVFLFFVLGLCFLFFVLRMGLRIRLQS